MAVYWAVSEDSRRRRGGRPNRGSSPPTFFTVLGPEPAVPVSPADGAVVVLSGRAPTFVWEPGACNEEFQIEFSDDPEFSPPIVTIPGRKTTENFYTPAIREWYSRIVYWRVRGFDDMNKSSVSAISSLRVVRRGSGGTRRLKRNLEISAAG